MPRPRLARVARLTCLVAVTAAAMAGCGGGGGDAPDLTQGMSAQQISDRAGEVAGKATTFYLKIHGTMQVKLTPAAQRAASSASVLDGPITMSGEGPVVLPEQTSIDASLNLGALPVQINLARVDDTIYASALGREFALRLPEAAVRAVDSRVILPSIGQWMADPRIVGREELDGQRVVRVEGPFDGQAGARHTVGILSWVTGVAGNSIPPARARRIQAALAPQMSRNGKVTLWVRTADLQPVRLHVLSDVPDASTVTDQLESMHTDLTFELSRWNEPMTVTAPKDAQPLSLAEMRDLLG